MKKRFKILALTLAICTICTVPTMAKENNEGPCKEKYVTGNYIKKNLNSQDQNVNSVELNNTISDLKKSDIYNGEEFQIKVVPLDKIEDNKKYVFANNSSEIVKFLKDDEIMLEQSTEKLNQHNVDIIETSLARVSKSKYRTVHRGLVRGIGVRDYKLSADITYNTSTQVISNVKNRFFRITGVTFGTQVANRRYGTYYSPSKKYVKITCNYTAVYKIATQAGVIEIYRKDAYQQFKWNAKRGVYEGKGGFGRADVSF